MRKKLASLPNPTARVRDSEASTLNVLAVDDSALMRQAITGCVVFGMPKEAIELGAAEEVLPLPRLARRMLQRVRSS